MINEPQRMVGDLPKAEINEKQGSRRFLVRRVVPTEMHLSSHRGL
jgi:hypothetical protein